MMLPPATRVYLACGFTDMRKGFDGLAAQVQTVLSLDPYGGALFVFRGRRGDLLKALHWDGQGLCLYAKRLELPRARFVWPQTDRGTITLSAAQVSMLLEASIGACPPGQRGPRLPRDRTIALARVIALVRGAALG